MKTTLRTLAAALAVAALPMSASASYVWTIDLDYIANSGFTSTTDLARVTVTANDPSNTGTASRWNFKIENLVGAKVFDFGFNFAGVGEVVTSSIFVDKPGPKDVTYALTTGTSPAPANVYGAFEYFFTADPKGQAVKSVSFDINTQSPFAYTPQSMPFNSLYTPGGKYALYTHVGAFDAGNLCVSNATGGQLCAGSFKVVNGDGSLVPPAGVPEPGTYALLFSGLLMLALITRRRLPPS